MTFEELKNKPIGYLFSFGESVWSIHQISSEWIQCKLVIGIWPWGEWLTLKRESKNIKYLKELSDEQKVELL